MKKYTTIIAGSRDCTDYKELLNAIDAIDWEIDLVMSGSARGVDGMGERWAIENNISINRFIPNWDKFGKSAGYIRNARMAEEAEALLALWDGKSKGTKHMIDLADSHNLKVHVWELK